METSAAIYVRRSALDDREGDNRSLAGHERECREWGRVDSHGSRVGFRAVTRGFSSTWWLFRLW